MIARLSLSNFKSISSLSVDFYNNENLKTTKEMVMIYGENGIGKTTLVESLKFLSESFYSISKLKGIDELINYAEKNNSITDKSFLSLFSQPNLPRIVGKYKTLGSDTMRLSFEFIVNKQKYVYDSTYDDNGIIAEKLSISRNNIFEVTKSSVYLNKKHFVDQDFSSIVLRYYHLYFGNHSLMACIYQSFVETNSKTSHDFLSNDIISFLVEIGGMYVSANRNEEDIDFGVFFNQKMHHAELLTNLISGAYTDKIETKLQKTKTGLSSFFSSLYQNIVGVDYDISGTDSKQYNLVFIEKNNNVVKRIPYSRESTGTRKLVNIFEMLYTVCSSNVIMAIDEIDNGINDILLKVIIESVGTSLKGQLIFTTHNTLLLNYKNKNNTYLLNREKDSSISIYSLSEFGRRVQSGTDVAKQYVKGLYGGVPTTHALSFNEIIDKINDCKN